MMPPVWWITPKQVTPLKMNNISIVLPGNSPSIELLFSES